MPGSRVARRVALAVLLAAAAREPAVHAHAALLISDPVDRVALGDTPASVRLSFSERPDAALSEIHVLDAAGAEYQVGRPLPAAADPLTLFVNIKPLDRGIYTVSWRTVSAVDGHASEGSFVFGVRAQPTAGPAPADTPGASASLPEGFARLLLITGLIALLGGTTATVARFGGRSDVALAAAGCLLAGAGIVLLAVTQAINARSPLARVLTTEVGRAVLWRAAALGVAAAALLVARFAGAGSESRRVTSMRVALLAALAAVAVHVANGHAAAADRWAPAIVASQWVHFAAAGVWFGGLAALLLAVRGQPAAWKAGAVRRFSRIATFAVILVAATGLVRSLGELTSWRDLIAAPYGLAVAAKAALTAGIAVLAAFNHWRSVAAASTDLTPLRRAGGSELALAGAALVAAALLGALPPPAAALKAPTGLVASGVDFGTTVRVRLTTPSNQPGPNRFAVRATDYDSGRTVDAKRVSLRFTAVDEPEMAPTVLDLARAADESFVGSGANLAFGGRWRITALIERAGDSTEVPMEVETAPPAQFLAVARPPGQPVTYRIQVLGTGHVWISPDPERAGHSTVTLTFWDQIQDPQPMNDVVVTLAAGDGAPREQPVTRTGRGAFAANVVFEPGRNRIAVVGHAANGKRLRAVLTLDVPR